MVAARGARLSLPVSDALPNTNLKNKNVHVRETRWLLLQDWKKQGGGESKKDTIRESMDSGGGRVGQVAEGHARDRRKVGRYDGLVG